MKCLNVNFFHVYTTWAIYCVNVKFIEWNKILTKKGTADVLLSVLMTLIGSEVAFSPIFWGIHPQELADKGCMLLTADWPNTRPSFMPYEGETNLAMAR